MSKSFLRQKATVLRKQGKTYSSIQRSLNIKIPKSTLSHWFRNLKLSPQADRNIKKQLATNLKLARLKSLATRRQTAINKMQEIRKRNLHLVAHLWSPSTARIVLAMIYACEGSKKRRQDSLTFGNSDPRLISLFLKLLRYCYPLDESKFRCTIQARADQSASELETYWSNLTIIPRRQFYATRFDERTRDIPTLKNEYKGVCRIDFFSANIFKELTEIFKLITEGP